MELIFRRPISIRGQSEPDSGRTDSGRKSACAKFLQKRLRKNFVNKQFSKKLNVRVFKKSNSEEHEQMCKKSLSQPDSSQKQSMCRESSAREPIRPDSPNTVSFKRSLSQADSSNSDTFNVDSSDPGFLRAETINAPLSGKYALVTGAAHGIGRAVSEALAAQHVNLHLVCVKAIDELQKFALQLEDRYQISCSADQLDVGRPEEVEDYFRKKIHTLDILVNNAGISYVGLLQDMTAEEWNRVIAVNLSSVFYTSKQAIPLFLSHNTGRIINISSVWGEVGASTEVAYSASKGGINAFTRGLAKELAPNHIPVNAVACGCIDTRMNDCFTEADKEALADEIPAGRFGSPEEAAETVIRVLCMPDYLTGQIITLDGGWI